MRNSQKGFAVPLLIGIIALLIVGGGVYIYENNKIETPVVTDNTTQQSNQVQQQTSTQTSPVNTQPNDSSSQTNTSFKIISPKAGDSLIIGRTYTVKFQNLPKGSFVQGWLQNMNEVNTGTASIGVVESGRDGNPSSNIQIKIPSQWCGGDCGAVQYVAPGQYRLQLRIYPSVQNPSYQTFYSDYFSITGQNITQSSITVLSPNGGETWQEGGIYQIKWVSQNIPLDAPGYVALTKDGSVVRVIKSIALNGGNLSNLGGSFSWSIPQEFVSEASPGKFKILISSTDNKISDYSDNQFTISASGGSQPVSNQSSVNVISPNGGEVWTKGMTQNITWTSPYYFRTTNVDLNLVPVPMICPSGYSCLPNYPSRYTIASNISANQNSFNWRVGDGSYIVMSPCGPNDPIPLDTVTHLPILGSNCNRGNKTVIVPDNQYTIQICESGTNICDSSNNYFTITTANSQTVSVRISFSSINENVYSLLNNTTILGLNYLYPRNNGNNTVINAIDPTIMSMGDSCGVTVQATLEIANSKIEGTHPTLHGDPTVAIDIIRVLSHDNPQRSCAY